MIMAISMHAQSKLTFAQVHDATRRDDFGKTFNPESHAGVAQNSTCKVRLAKISPTEPLKPSGNRVL